MTNRQQRDNIVKFAGQDAERKALLKSVGFSNEDFRKPVIGIANSWNTMVPGHYNLQVIAEHVKKGIHCSGGTAVEFGVISCCDGLACGESQQYILPSRENICNSIEVVARAHRLDGLVLLGSCDKIIPGMLMAAARLNIPSILVNGGPMLGGVIFDNRKSDSTTMVEAHGMYKGKKITHEEFKIIEDLVCPTYGSCSFLGTANTMACLAEAMGMSLPGSALVPAVYSERLRIAEYSGEAICSLVKKGIKCRQVINKKSLENAVRICLAIGGSTNSVLHLSAIAHEGEVAINIIDTFDELNKVTPVLVKVNPAGKGDMEDFYRAGGIPRVMEYMKTLLHTEVITCTEKTIECNIQEFSYKYADDNEIIKTLEQPFAAHGGIAVLRGNLAPNTAISKPSAIDSSVHKFTGSAVVFNSEEEAIDAILNERIQDGNVIIIRYEGPKGGPGMREMYLASKYLYGMGLGKSTAIVSDGRFSGTNNGCFVGHVSPEAAEGGPIAVVQDGDQISIDVIEGILHLHVSEEEINERLKNWQRPIKKIKKGYMEIYERFASSANEGAIVKLEK